MRNALLFGIVWGLSELVLGTILHLFPIGTFAVCLLYPIGFYCMFRLYLRTGKVVDVLNCGLIAATIKLLALLVTLPTPSLFIVKPAVYILSETFATAFVLYVPVLYTRLLHKIH